MSAAYDVPPDWYNVLSDLGMELSPTVPAGPAARIRPNVTMELVRQSMPMRTWVPIPSAVLDAYRGWRPTPLRRLARLEAALGAHARIYVKDETGNVAGSHKYLTALAQAHYCAQAGVRTLLTSTAAGQWGTAIAAAARRFGLRCRVYMVPGSYDRKPGRRAAMELLGAEVVRAAEHPGRRASLRDAMTQAVAGVRDSDEPTARWILGGSEPFAILHTTVIGLEAREQLRAAGETAPPVLIGYLGGGKNVGGLGLPFLASSGTASSGTPEIGAAVIGAAEIRAVESTAYPVLTRGVTAYDSSDDTGLTPRAMTRTLGGTLGGAPIQAEGMRYRAAPPLINALYDRGLVRAVAYDEQAIFDSARLLLVEEGLLPSAEAMYAVHDACVQARDPRHDDRAIVFCLSDHGYYDGDAYRAYLDARLATSPPEEGSQARCRRVRGG
jgi:tryptophan synthase beta chain